MDDLSYQRGALSETPSDPVSRISQRLVTTKILWRRLVRSGLTMKSDHRLSLFLDFGDCRRTFFVTKLVSSSSLSIETEYPKLPFLFSS